MTRGLRVPQIEKQSDGGPEVSGIDIRGCQMARLQTTSPPPRQGAR